MSCESQQRRRSPKVFGLRLLFAGVMFRGVLSVSAAVVPALAVLSILGGCASQDEMGPDLEPAKQGVEQRLRSLDAAEQTISDELEELEQRRRELEALIGQLSGYEEMPFSLLRLVAMNCINAAYGGVSAEGGRNIGGMLLTCQPAHLNRLEEQLGDKPTAVQDRAYELLYAVDQARLSRGSLRRRLSALPRSVNEHHQFMADERAMLRQLEGDLEQNRNVYSSAQWQRVNQRVDDYRELLRQLEARIEQLADDYPQWPRRVDETMTDIYFELAELRAAK